MKVELHSTEKLVQLEIDGHTVPARIWEGKTAGGIACHAYITRIAVHKDEDASEFERELHEHEPPTRPVQEIPLHLIL